MIPRVSRRRLQEYAQADFGPNLSNMAAKFQSKPDGLKWLSNWIGCA